MSGPEHYREAERLLGVAADPVTAARPGVTAQTIAGVLAVAQVHATLAAAAATIEAARAGLVQDLAPEWRETLR